MDTVILAEALDHRPRSTAMSEAPNSYNIFKVQDTPICLVGSAASTLGGAFEGLRGEGAWGVDSGPAQRPDNTITQS